MAYSYYVVHQYAHIAHKCWGGVVQITKQALTAFWLLVRNPHHHLLSRLQAEVNFEQLLHYCSLEDPARQEPRHERRHR